MSFLIKAVQDISYLTLALLPNSLSYSADRNYELGNLATSDPDVKAKMLLIASMMEEVPRMDYTKSVYLGSPSSSPVDKEMAQIWKSIATSPEFATKRGRELKCLWSCVESFGLWGLSLSKAAVLGLNGSLIVTLVVLTPVISFAISILFQQTQFENVTRNSFEWGQHMQNFAWYGGAALFIANIAITPRASILVKQIVVIALTSWVFKKLITYVAYKTSHQQIKQWENDVGNNGINFQLIDGKDKVIKTNYLELINRLAKLVETQRNYDRDPSSCNLSSEVDVFRDKMNKCKLHVCDYVWVTKYLRYLHDCIK